MDEAELAPHPVIRSLAAAHVLRCPRCRGQLVDDAAGMVCTSCGTAFAAYNGVLDLFGMASGGSDIDPGPVVSLQQAVMTAMTLPASAGDRVAAALARTAQISSDNAAFDAEIRDLADRFGLEPTDHAEQRPVAPTITQTDRLSLTVERHYVPPVMTPGARVTCNVRFKNTADTAISSDSVPPVMVGFRWLDANDVVVEMPEQRTRFPIPLTPLRSMTLPVEIVVPDAPGAYRLLVCPVIETVRWAPECGVVVHVRVGETDGSAAAALLDLRPDEPGLAYADDHTEGLTLLGQWAATQIAAPGCRILEIGSGAAPQVSWFGAKEVVSVDINLPLLELGALWYEHNAPPDVANSVAFLCADATKLPFEDDSFDLVVMFSTLHHFGEPEVLLGECRRITKGDGRVAVMCEPVGPTLEVDVTIRDLEKGINEQVFIIPEYLRIFSAAGLEPVDGNQVGGSLRIALRPTEPTNEGFTAVQVPSTAALNGGAHAPDTSSPSRVLRGAVRRLTRLVSPKS